MEGDRWERLSTLVDDVQAEVQERLEHLPSGVALAARRTVPSTPATKDALDRAERRLGFALPQDLRRWLRICNGSVIGPGGVYGIETSLRELDIEYILGLRPAWQSRGWLPVAGDGSGDYWILDCAAEGDWPRGGVFFVDQSDMERLEYVVAANLCSFLTFLLESDLEKLRGARAVEATSRWPFDQRFVLARDPMLAAFPESLLPWGGAHGDSEPEAHGDT
jgi:cell wall assembly regulator SMI1